MQNGIIPEKKYDIRLPSFFSFPEKFVVEVISGLLLL